MGRRRIPEPALLAILLFAAALVAAALVIAGCDPSGEGARTPEPSSQASEAELASEVAYMGSAAKRAGAIAERCRWDRHGIGKNDAGLAQAVRRGFADAGGAPIRLLLSSRPSAPAPLLRPRSPTTAMNGRRTVWVPISSR